MCSSDLEPWGTVTPLAWGAFVYVLVMFTFTVVIWFGVIERVGAAHAALYQNLQPFLGAVFALLLLSEPLHWLQLVGAVVLAASIVLAQRREAPERAAQLAPAGQGEAGS